MEKTTKTYYVAKFMNKYLNFYGHYPSLTEDPEGATVATTCDDMIAVVDFHREALKENNWFPADIEIAEVVKTVTVTETIVFNQRNRPVSS